MLYPPEAADLLDFQAVKDMAAEHAATRKGRLMLREAQPRSERSAIEPELLQVDELLRLMERGHFFPAVAAAEVDDALPMLRAALQGDPWFEGPGWAQADQPRPQVSRT